jgi:hypothetical protein
MITDLPSQERGVPKTSHGRGVLKAHALGLRSHVLGVLARLALVWEIHIHGLWALRSISLSSRASGLTILVSYFQEVRK